MPTKYSTFILYMIALGASIALAPICNADQYHSKSFIYRIELPQDWIEIPQNVLHETVDALMNQKSSTSIIYDAGFQLDSTDHWFEYPYVMVQILPYAKFGSHRQINEDEFPEFVRRLTGINVGKLLDKTVSSDVRQLFANIDTGKPQLDVANRRYFWAINMDVQDIGPIRSIIVGYFGRNSIVQVTFSTRRAEWNRYADARETIFNSFSFYPNKAYSVQVAASNPSRTSIWTGVLEKGISGGFAILLLGGIAVATRKKTGTTKVAVDGKKRNYESRVSR